MARRADGMTHEDWGTGANPGVTNRLVWKTALLVPVVWGELLGPVPSGSVGKRKQGL